MLNFLPSKEHLHHAYVITATKLQQIKEDLENFITEKIGIPFHGNPDVFIGEYGNVGIDDLNDVMSMHQRVPIGPKKVIVLLANGITTQAQNSILKMIEEPTANTHFFIGLPTSSMLLPTVLSRVHLIETERDTAGEKADPKIKSFLSASTPERLNVVKEFMTDLDKERITKEEVVQFISGVVAAAHQNFVEGKNKTPDTLVVLSHVTDYLRDPSSSLKMVFEYLALRLA